MQKVEGKTRAEPKIRHAGGVPSEKVKNLTSRRVGLLPDRNENRLNVGRGFTPRRKNFFGRV